MNRYGNEVGYHSPELTKINKAAFESVMSLEFNCCSWHNDTVDSISNDELNIQIFLPNSVQDDPDEELFNSYCLTSADGDDEAINNYMDDAYSFMQIVKIIKEIQKRIMDLEEEKEKVFTDIGTWVMPIIEDKKILTAHMLDAIIAKCNHLKKTDF